MGIPQILMIVWICVSWGLSVGLHGKPKDGTWNMYYTGLTAILLGLLLYFGGFFS